MSNNFRSVKNVIEPFSNLNTTESTVFGKVNNSILVSGNTLPGDKPFKVIELFGEEIPGEQLVLKDSNGNIWKASEEIEIIGAEMSIHYTDSVSGSIIPSRFRVGDDIDGEALYDESGYSVAMSSDGNRIAIGARLHDSDGSDFFDDRGHVRVYDWKDGSWVKVGDIDGEATEDYSGHSVAMSSDGTRIAIGAVYNDGDTNDINDDRGHVRVFDWNGNAWTPVGDIDGDAAGDQLGYSVAMSSDGTRIAIGARYNQGVNGPESGHVRVFDWNGTAWTPVGDIDGDATGDYSGWSVAMSDDGNRIAIGAIRNYGDNGIRIRSGHVRVYAQNRPR